MKRLLFGLLIIIMKKYTGQKESQEKNMTRDIMDFIEYIHNEKQTSKNTEVSYERDLRR